MPCEHQVDIRIGTPVRGVWQVLSQKNQIAAFKVSFVNHELFKMDLSKKMGLWSSGEIIIVSLYDSGDGGTILVATSKPALPTVLVDFGRNKKNVNAIAEYVSSLFIDVRVVFSK